MDTEVSFQSSCFYGKSWHREEDIFIRRKILQTIVELLGSAAVVESNPTLHFMLNSIAERFELTLYSTSSTLEEYMDLNTLPNRLYFLLQLAKK